MNAVPFICLCMIVTDSLIQTVHALIVMIGYHFQSKEIINCFGTHAFTLYAHEKKKLFAYVAFNTYYPKNVWPLDEKFCDLI